MATFLSPLLIALSLMSRLPVARWLPDAWEDKAVGQSSLYYPLVGVILATVLMAVDGLLASASPTIQAVVILVVWVGITGALHLDGLADCVDAMFAGHSVLPKQRSPEQPHCPKQQTLLRVLKDPSVGAMGATVLITLLLLKLCLLIELAHAPWQGLLMALVLSRTCALLFITITPYTPHATQRGIGATLTNNVPVSGAFFVVFGVVFVVFFVMPFYFALCLLGSLAVVIWLWRYYWLKRLEGFVGDSVGALIEMSEVVTLFIIYYLSVLS